MASVQGIGLFIRVLQIRSSPVERPGHHEIAHQHLPNGMLVQTRKYWEKRLKGDPG
jgi:hypothetical protein